MAITLNPSQCDQLIAHNFHLYVYYGSESERNIYVKVKVTLEQTTKAQRGVDIQFYSFFNLRANVGGGFNPGEDPVPILQEAGWAPGPVWTGA